MHSHDFQILDRMKAIALQRCQERIVEASKEPAGQKKKVPAAPPHYGVTTLLKGRHGL